MKYQKLLLVLLFGIFVVSQSCEKKEIVDVENAKIENQIGDVEKNIQQAEQFIYYLDNEKIRKSFFSNYNNKQDLLNITTSEIDQKTKKIINVIYAFTTEAGYIEFGEKHNLKLKEGLDFAKHMREYAEKSGAIEHFEKTGEFLESYSKYEAAYYQKVFGKKNSKAAWVLYEYKDGYGSYIGVPYFWMLGSLGRSWKNRVSSVNDYGPGALITLYDRTFFRRFLTTCAILIRTNLPPHANNKAESVVTY